MQYKLQKKEESGEWVDMVRKDGLHGVNRFKDRETAWKELLLVWVSRPENWHYRVETIKEE